MKLTPRLAIGFAVFALSMATGTAAEFETETIQIEKIVTGAAHRGKNPFTAIVRNKTNAPIKFILDLRAMPGLWLGPNMQRQFPIVVRPRDATRIDAEYEFSHLSPEAVLRVRMYPPEMGKPFFDKSYEVGRDNNDVDADISRFERRDTKHYVIYYMRGTLAAADSNRISVERDSGFEKIASMIGVSLAAKIRLVFFPDESSKFGHTGHRGAGLATGDQIVEVYNEATKLDPYHETAHILSGQLGSPAALFSEGFAVYASEVAGADALRYLGSAGKSCDEAVAAHITAGAFIDLPTLFGFEEIGSDRTRPSLAYPEACSVAGYLVRRFGIEKFREAFSKVGAGDEAAFAAVYGMPLRDIERAWMSGLKVQAREQDGR